MASSQPSPPSCILLVFGVPGSGKTILTDSLVSRATGADWTLFPVHFDVFYPPDIRAAPSPTNAEDSPDQEREHFALKIERQKVTDCVEWLVRGRVGTEQQSEGTPLQLWDKFRETLAQYGRLTQRKEGGSLKLPCPSVIILDDNFHLRSMRYQYYQMARKYELGFAELCICCSISVAAERNIHRQAPILQSTITDMHQRLELPEPSQHYWERKSAILYNNGGENQEEFMSRGWTIAKGLMEDALAEPELPYTQEDNTLKEASRAASLESYLHQADVILRKCVSTSFKTFTGQDKVMLGQQANAIRKELLEEARTGSLIAQHGLQELPPTSPEFASALQRLFRDRLNI